MKNFYEFKFYDGIMILKIWANESYVEPSEKEAHLFMPKIKMSVDIECKKDKVSQEEYYWQMRMYYTYRAENDSSNVTEQNIRKGVSARMKRRRIA